MFSQCQSVSKKTVASKFLSVAAHAVILYALVRPARPIFVSPSSVMHGDYGNSTELVSTANAGIEYPRLEQRFRLKPKPKIRPHHQQIPQTKVAQAPRAGTPFGTLLEGPATGHDVRPALPIAFPDPVVRRSELPAGAEGSVIVEITIDEQGNVIATNVLKISGLGVEERVLAALRKWRFRPATMDGRAIASKQDVYFHFPS